MPNGTFAISSGGNVLSKSAKPRILGMEGTCYPSGSLMVMVKRIVSVPCSETHMFFLWRITHLTITDLVFCRMVSHAGRILPLIWGLSSTYSFVTNFAMLLTQQLLGSEVRTSGHVRLISFSVKWVSWSELSVCGVPCQ